MLKLPTRLQLKWTDRAAGYKLKHKAMFPPFSYFVNFIKEMTSVMNDPGLALTVAEATQHGGGSRRQDFNRGPGISVKKTTLLNETTVVNGQKSCPIHPEVNSHSLCDCREFMKKSLTNRKQFLKDKSICYRCCSSDKHVVKNCTVPVKCAECGSSKHVTALHQPKYNVSEGKSNTKVETPHGGEQPENVNFKCTLICGEGFYGRSCAKVVLVDVFPEGQPDAAVPVYALLDDQSNRSLATSELLDSLGVVGTKVQYTLSSCLGSFKSSGRRARGFVIRSSDRSNSLTLPSMIECNDIPTDDSEIPTPGSSAF